MGGKLIAYLVAYSLPRAGLILQFGQRPSAGGEFGCLPDHDRLGPAKGCKAIHDRAVPLNGYTGGSSMGRDEEHRI